MFLSYNNNNWSFRFTIYRNQHYNQHYPDCFSLPRSLEENTIKENNKTVQHKAREGESEREAR